MRPASTTSLETCVTAKLGSSVVVSKVTTLIPRPAACSSGAWSASASVAATISASGLRATAALTIGICDDGLVLRRRLLLDRDAEPLRLLLGAEPDRVEEVVAGDPGDEHELVVRVLLRTSPPGSSSSPQPVWKPRRATSASAIVIAI